MSSVEILFNGCLHVVTGPSATWGTQTWGRCYGWDHSTSRSTISAASTSSSSYSFYIDLVSLSKDNKCLAKVCILFITI